jgi:hypothetical protein
MPRRNDDWRWPHPPVANPGLVAGGKIAPAKPDQFASIVEELLRDNGLLEAWHHTPLNLTELPASLFPAWPGVMPLIVNDPEASVQKLLRALRNLERLVVYHQLFIAGNMKPRETALDVPA